MAASLSLRAIVLSLYFSVSGCHFTVPLKIFPGSYNLSAGVDVSAFRRVTLTSDGSGLSLASDPTGTVNFLDMVNNLQGDSGRGYYIEILIGTPGQKVSQSCLKMCLECLCDVLDPPTRGSSEVVFFTLLKGEIS